jgi:hypothetical protein
VAMRTFVHKKPYVKERLMREVFSYVSSGAGSQ